MGRISPIDQTHPGPTASVGKLVDPLKRLCTGRQHDVTLMVSHSLCLTHVVDLEEPDLLPPSQQCHHRPHVHRLGKSRLHGEVNEAAWGSEGYRVTIVVTPTDSG